jgi:flagellin
MPLVINTNVASLNAQRNLNESQGALQTALQRLSTGLRINSAKDDAAGLAIAERFTAQIRGLNQATRNANDGISFAQTAEGALGTIGNALQRIRELAVQSANDTNSSSDRQAINNEVSQLIAEVNRVANSTQFNGQNILDGSSGTLVFQVGANEGQTIDVTGVDARASKLGASVQTGETITSSELEAMVTNGDVLTINGTDFTFGSDPTTADITEGDVDSVIEALNLKFSETGVQAQKASSTSATLTYTAATDGDRVLSINNVDVSIAEGATIEDVLDAVNAVSNQTGVTASSEATGTGTTGDIVFANTSGADIELAIDADPAADTTAGETVDNPFGGALAQSAGAAGSESFQAGIVLAAEVGETPSLSFTGTGTLAQLGLTAGDFTNEVLGDVNVLTRENASEALSTLDFALQQINGQRAQLGAVQTRFESTISNLGITAENLSAARSRIQDADFAAETAALTKAQILQQAGTSVLAQANAIPQNVLSLLQ